MILNLDQVFTPLGDGIGYDSFTFPSGCEVHIKLPHIEVDSITITTRIKVSDDIMTLIMATDAIKRMGISNIKLLLPYLPYARQDRKMVEGEPLSLKVFSDIINSQKYSRVGVYDVHSDVSTALINNCISFNNHNFVSEVLRDKTRYLIVSPDAGAYKKIFKLCQHLKYQDEIIMCNKMRDVSNGVIRSLTISHESINRPCYIVDDICDGGATFMMLSDELRRRGAPEVNLIVSHGIFSRGIDFIKNIDHIYTTNSFNDFTHNKLTQIKLNNGFLSG